MKHLLVEIKARCPDPSVIRRQLLAAGADARGTDHQVDTYFNCLTGRLKLREGNIERSLIHYERANQAGPKDSHVSLCTFQDKIPRGLKEVLTAANGVLVEVDKHREIFFIDNVKFHLDQVASLGSFVEIEAIGRPGVDRQTDLLRQCNQYLRLFEIPEADLVEVSYSDLILAQAPA